MVVTIMKDLVPICTVEFTGEKIKKALFVNVGGGEKTIIVFESGKVVVLPVYKKCPVQVGTVEDLRGDREEILKSIVSVRQQAIDEADQMIRLIKEL